MKQYSTKELVEELCKRAGVETCWIRPEWQYEVAVMTDQPRVGEFEGAFEYLKGGMHEGNNKGPAWILVVTD